MLVLISWGLYRGLNYLIALLPIFIHFLVLDNEDNYYERHLAQCLEHSKSTEVFAMITLNHLPLNRAQSSISATFPTLLQCPSSVP